MSSKRTISSSQITRSFKETYSFNPFKSFKEFTFANKETQNKQNTTNLLKKCYPGFLRNPQMNRSGWLDKKELETKECKELDGRIFKRKIKPDNVSFVIDMDCQIEFQKEKSKTRNLSNSFRQKSSNSIRTILPEKDIESARIDTLPRRGRPAALYKQSTQGKIKHLIEQKTASVPIPEMSNHKRKSNPTFLSNGVFKTMKNQNFREQRIQQSVDLIKLRESKNYAGAFVLKNNFLEKSNNEKSNRSPLLKYTSSTIFSMRTDTNFSSTFTKFDKSRNCHTNEKSMQTSVISTNNNSLFSTLRNKKRKMTYWG